MFKTINFLVKKSPIIILSLILYIILIRPARVELTKNIYKPLVNKMGIEVMELKDGDTEILVKIKEKRIPLKMPFGAYFWPPVILLYFSNSYNHIKVFSFYHFIITLIIPLCLLIPVFNNVWSILPVKTLRFLTEFIGWVFILIGFQNINNYLTND